MKTFENELFLFGENGLQMEMASFSLVFQISSLPYRTSHRKPTLRDYHQTQWLMISTGRRWMVTRYRGYIGEACRGMQGDHEFLSSVRVALGDVQLELAHVRFCCHARGDANTYNEG
jgi:hypothetical protein